MRPAGASVLAALALNSMLLGAGASDRSAAAESVSVTRHARGAQQQTSSGQGVRADTVPLVDIAGVPDDLFRVSGAVRLSTGEFMVADGAPRIMVFDRSGRRGRVVAARGSGPGEFQSIAWLQATGQDSVIAYDPSLRRVSVLSASRGVVRSFALQRSSQRGMPVAVSAFADGSLLAAVPLLATRPPGAWGLVRPSWLLYRHDRDGNTLDSLGVVPGDEVATIQGIIMRPRFARRTQLVAGDAEYYVATADSFAVSVFAMNGRAIRTGRRSYRPVQVANADLQFAPRGALEAAQSRPAYPAIGQVLADPTAGIWVSEFPAMPTATPAWYVLGRDSRFSDAVAMPSRLRPLQIGNDYLLGVWQDSLDVEHVRMYRLHRTAR